MVHINISIINLVGFQKMCSSARERILLWNSIGCITKDSKETAKDIISSVTFHDMYIFISIKNRYQRS